MLPNYYQLYCPVKILSGQLAVSNIPFEMKLLGCRRAMVVTDKGVVKAGLIDIVKSAFADSDMKIGRIFDEAPQDSVDYVDGAVIKTTNLGLTIEKKADLIICYNPFRPFNLDLFCEQCEANKGRLRIAEDGIYAIFNQVMRTVLHTRLMHGISLYRKNPDFKGDIILVEPSEYDDKFFDMNPMSFQERRVAAKRGYDSVRQSIADDYEILKKILGAYGIKTNPKFKTAPVEEAPSMIAACPEPMAA